MFHFYDGIVISASYVIEDPNKIRHITNNNKVINKRLQIYLT